MERNNLLKKWTKWVFCFAFITLAYQNCGAPSSNRDLTAPQSSASTTGDIIPLPNTKTASVVRSSRVLDTLVSCLGTGTPNNESKAEMAKYRGTISEEGLANTLTQPMVKSLAVVSSEVCAHLVSKETGGGASPRIFEGVDFDSGEISSSEMTQVTKRIARSCWGRNAKDEEISTIVDNVNQTFFGSQDNRETVINKMVYLCTAMAASFATYEM